MRELTPQRALADLFNSDDFPALIPDPQAAAEIVIQRLLDAGFEIKPVDLERGSTARAMQPSAEETHPCHLTRLLSQ
jgi:hypothetical protein